MDSSPRDPLDEEAAWAEIVAGYGEAPVFPTSGDERGEVPPRGQAAQDGGGAGPGSGSGPREDRGDAPDTRPARAGAGAAPEDGEAEAEETDASGSARPGQAPDTARDAPPPAPPAAGGRSPGGFVVYAPGVGPRDWRRDAGRGDEEDDADAEGHFVPPEPPPLPQADVTAKFAWLAVLGGPLLLVVMLLLQQPVTWWVATLGVGGFLGGFGTLVARMHPGDEDDEDHRPGGGAVV